MPFMLSTKVNICETQTSPSYQTASEKKKKRKVSGSREQGGTPLHVQRVLRESSEEAGIINNA